MRAKYYSFRNCYRVIVPARLTGTGRQKALYFRTEEEANKQIERIKEQQPNAPKFDPKMESILGAIDQLSAPDKYRIYRKLRREMKSRDGNPESTVCYRQNVQFRIRVCLGNRLRELVHNGKAQGGKIIKIIGCDIPWLMAWLEVHFQFDMTWENYGKVWHIDHKRPCAAFDLTKAEEQKACFHWTNLQPLYARENLSKGAKILAA